MLASVCPGYQTVWSTTLNKKFWPVQASYFENLLVLLSVQAVFYRNNLFYLPNVDSNTWRVKYLVSRAKTRGFQEPRLACAAFTPSRAVIYEFKSSICSFQGFLASSRSCNSFAAYCITRRPCQSPGTVDT